jgi:ATP-binding cassette subfamily F protein uup
MTLLSLLDAHLAYGDRPLLDGAQLTVQAGERLGLIGRNGTGKSSLLRIIAAQTKLDAGELQQRSGLRVALVEQEPELPAAATLGGSLLRRDAQGVGGQHNHVREFAHLESSLGVFLPGQPGAGRGVQADGGGR